MVDADERLQAAFMDTVYRDADRADVAYYVDRATNADGPVLELGCGTGRIYLEMLEAGIDADGLDRSMAALAVLRDRAEDQGLAARVWRGDMTDVSVDRPYALVICPFNAIQELTTVEDQLALLEAAHGALAPGGAFVFDTFIPDFEYIAEAWGTWQQRTIEFRETPVEYHTRTRLTDEVTQEYTAQKRATAPDGTELVSFEGQATLLPYRELDLLARLSPFAEWDVTGDYTDEPLSDGHTAQVWSLYR